MPNNPLANRRKSHTVRLDEAPVGLFMCMGELCVKTQYREPNGGVTAYIVSSGEFFCGPSPQTVATQNAADVTPLPEAFVTRLIETWENTND